MEGQDRVESGASAKYIYAVIPRVARGDFGAVGIAGARVYTLAHRAIAAVVHDCPPEPYQGEPETVAGWVKNAYRAGEEIGLTTLGELLEAPIDMWTTVVVGSSRTELVGGRMVTRRGYGDKYGFEDVED
jgi:hypothetical protein